LDSRVWLPEAQREYSGSAYIYRLDETEVAIPSIRTVYDHPPTVFVLAQLFYQVPTIFLFFQLWVHIQKRSARHNPSLWPKQHHVQA
jgi:hypothetical protein